MKNDTDYRVIDEASAYKKSYLGVVFLRNERVKSDISLIKWVWLTLVEIIVGSEILESIVTTGSVYPHDNIEKDDSIKYGAELHLNLHIPSGIITNFLRNHIIELLYYKFYYQYLIFRPVGVPDFDDDNKTINCTRTRFRADKGMFYQLIALRRVYDLSWLLINLSIDLIVFCFFQNIESALISAILVEGIRRLLKI